jgi:hypothetical protein
MVQSLSIAKRLKGIFAPTVTAYHPDESVNLAGTRQFVRFLLDQGIHGLAPLGSAGEPVALTLPERMRLLEAIVTENNGQVPVFAGTGDYSTSQLANTSLNRWALMPRLAATYFDPKSGWQVNGCSRPCRELLEGSILKNFGRLGVGAVGYGMIQTTADSGVGARLGANEAQIYAAGPIITYSLGDPKVPLTFVANYFR